MTASSGQHAPPLDVVFIGTPEFAVPSLEAMAVSSHNIVCVVTAPARPAGRGLRAQPSPVRRAAERLGIPVVTVSPGDPGALATLLAETNPDVVTVVAWGGLLNKHSLAAPRLATLNVHASLLPSYRGAAPVERALMAGETVTGVTVMYLAEGLDTGDILLQREIPVPPDADAGRARELLAAAGADLLVSSVDLLATGRAPRTAQDHRLASWAPKLQAADERISWHTDASEIANRVRALSPHPGAYFVCGGRRIKVLKARPAPGQGDSVEGRQAGILGGQGAEPGTVLGRKEDSLIVAAAAGTALLVDLVQPAGGRLIPGASWANGLRLTAGTVISNEGGAD